MKPTAATYAQAGLLWNLISVVLIAALVAAIAIVVLG